MNMDALCNILNDHENNNLLKTFQIIEKLRHKKYNLKFENTLNQGTVCLISVT